MMDNRVLLARAIDLLVEVASDDIETMQLETDKYDDGSIRLTINVAFFAPEDKTTERK